METLVAAAGFFALWLLFRPYEGIVSDTLLYVSRAVADLDPNGVGRDWMFVTDGQMRFSLFPVFLRGAVAWLGPSLAAEATALLALSFWFGAFALLARQFASGKLFWLMLALVAVLPCYYSPFMLYVGEAVATPRPFAEGLVLLALTMLLRGRAIFCVLLLCASALLHPIMALAGFGVLATMLLSQDQRWALAPLVLLAGLALAWAFGLAQLDRLVKPLDPEWRGILDPRLFPSHWDADTLGAVATSWATLVMAAGTLDKSTKGRQRRLLLGAVAVGAGGLAASWLLGDLGSNLLVVQAQLWRTCWLAVALSSVAGALVLADVRKKAPADWIAPALLALAWSPVGGGQKIAVCVLALALQFARNRGKTAFSDQNGRILSGLVLLFAAWAAAKAIAGFLSFLGGSPDGVFALRAWIFQNQLESWPIAALACLVFWRGRSLSPIFRGALALALVAAAVLSWDVRSDYRRALDSGRRIPELAAVVAERPGEVFWGQGANESWYGLGRPNWVSEVQGSAIVFSREQAILWKSRADRAVAAGLESRSAIEPAGAQGAEADPELTADRLKAFCARDDAPAWIVWPLKNKSPPPQNLEPRASWTPPKDNSGFATEGGKTVWKTTTGFILLACAGKR